MAASIPVLRVLLREIKPATDRYNANAGGGGYGYGGYGGPGGAYYVRSAGTYNSNNSAAVYSLASRRGTGTGESSHHHHQSTVVTVTGGKKHHHHYPGSPTSKQGSGGLGLDDRSDKSILNGSQGSVFEAPKRQSSGGGVATAAVGNGHGGIMQTNEVSIDYENTYVLDEKFDEGERHVGHMA